MTLFKKKIDFSHINLSEKEKENLYNIKFMLRDNTTVFQKMQLAIDAENFVCKGLLSENEQHFLMIGGALMYQIINNPEFLNQCKNIYIK